VTFALLLVAQWLAGVRKNMFKNYNIAKQYWQYGQVWGIGPLSCFPSSRAQLSSSNTDKEIKEAFHLRGQALGPCSADGQDPNGSLQ
jgi:hypothetical protein